MGRGCREACRMVESLRGVPGDRLSAALGEAAARRDPSVFYHRLSELAPDYYGGDPIVPWVDEYYHDLGGGIPLPEPPRLAGVDVLEAIRERRSRRSYSGDPLSLSEIAAVLYYTVGVTGRAWWGGPRRAYPSAGALQPVEAYLVAARVEGLEPGAYHYNPGRHSLEPLRRGDYSGFLYEASLEQEHVSEAPAVVVLTIVYPRTASKYGYRAYRYALLDAGFAGENLYLAAEALGLATVAVGAFYDEKICWLLRLDCGVEYPVLLFPVGRRPTS